MLHCTYTARHINEYNYSYSILTHSQGNALCPQQNLFNACIGNPQSHPSYRLYFPFSCLRSMVYHNFSSLSFSFPHLRKTSNHFRPCRIYGKITVLFFHIHFNTGHVSAVSTSCLLPSSEPLTSCSWLLKAFVISI